MAKNRDTTPVTRPTPGRRPTSPPPGTSYFGGGSTGYFGGGSTSNPSPVPVSATPITNTTTTTSPAVPATGSAVSGEDSYLDAEAYLESFIAETLGISGLGSYANGRRNAGASVEEIIQAIRNGTDKSPEGQTAYASYLAAFPGIDALRKDGKLPGMRPELTYLEYVNTVQDAARRYGVDPSLATKEKVASYIAGNNSPAEIVSRMSTAAAAVATTPPETLALLKQYYGVSAGDLVTFYLNPDETEAMLQQRYTAAQIGTEAVRQQFGITQTEAEMFAQRGIDAGTAARSLAVAGSQKSFMGGAGETATREEILAASMGDQAAQQKIERVAASRTGRFQEGGGYAGGQQGISGLGTAATR